jgi:hypothetical protein
MWKAVCLADVLYPNFQDRFYSNRQTDVHGKNTKNPQIRRLNSKYLQSPSESVLIIEKITYFVENEKT